MFPSFSRIGLCSMSHVNGSNKRNFHERTLHLSQLQPHSR